MFEYLIRTYTQPGELVLDPCVGSGTTALAARNTGRHFICGDMERKYVDIARQRLAAPWTPPLFVDEPAAETAEQLSMEGI
jgi:tRNA G10  N-methylase Trm11